MIPPRTRQPANYHDTVSRYHCPTGAAADGLRCDVAEERGPVLVPGRRLRMFGNGTWPHTAAGEREIRRNVMSNTRTLRPRRSPGQPEGQPAAGRRPGAAQGLVPTRWCPPEALT